MAKIHYPCVPLLTWLLPWRAKWAIEDLMIEVAVKNASALRRAKRMNEMQHVIHEQSP